LPPLPAPPPVPGVSSSSSLPHAMAEAITSDPPKSSTAIRMPHDKHVPFR
jgi:hypothetical protein